MADFAADKVFCPNFQIAILLRSYFLKKRKLCMQKLMKEQKLPPVVILQKAIFYNISTSCLWLISEDPIMVVSS